MKTITIPESVTEICSYAFSLCSGLVSLTYLGDSEIKNDIGLLSNEGVKVFVKDGYPYRSFGGVPLTSSNDSNDSKNSKDSKKLGAGAIEGLVAGAVVLAVNIVGCVVFIVVYHNKEDEEQEMEPI